MRKYASPVFQHRHYAAIAKVLSDLDRSNVNPDFASVTAQAFTSLFARNNPRFDKERFYSAARGIPSHGKDKR